MVKPCSNCVVIIHAEFNTGIIRIVFPKYETATRITQVLSICFSLTGPILIGIETELHAV